LDLLLVDFLLVGVVVGIRLLGGLVDNLLVVRLGVQVVVLLLVVSYLLLGANLLLTVVRDLLLEGVLHWV
jgi:hypothetical protein